MATQTGKFAPCLPAVSRTEQGRIFDSGVNCVRIGERWLEMPHTLELPGTRRAIVELVRGERLAGFRRSVVNKLIALALGHAIWGGSRFAGGCSRLMPCLTAVI